MIDTLYKKQAQAAPDGQCLDKEIEWASKSHQQAGIKTSREHESLLINRVSGTSLI